MRDINKAIVVGRLTRDPELRRTSGGLAVLDIGIAVNDSRKNQQTGEWEDYANFLDCVLMGDRAEKVAPMLSKGMKVAIEGKLRWSQWEKNGQKRSKVEILVDQIEFMGKKHDSSDGYVKAPEDYQTSVYDDDIPF